MLPFFKYSCYFFFLNPWRVELWSVIEEKPYTFNDFNVEDKLGTETSFKPHRARNVSVSKLHSMITCHNGELLEPQSISKSIIYALV